MKEDVLHALLNRRDRSLWICCGYALNQPLVWRGSEESSMSEKLVLNYVLKTSVMLRLGLRPCFKVRFGLVPRTLLGSGSPPIKYSGYLLLNGIYSFDPKSLRLQQVGYMAQ